MERKLNKRRAQMIKNLNKKRKKSKYRPYLWGKTMLNCDRDENSDMESDDGVRGDIEDDDESMSESYSTEWTKEADGNTQIEAIM